MRNGLLSETPTQPETLNYKGLLERGPTAFLCFLAITGGWRVRCGRMIGQVFLGSMHKVSGQKRDPSREYIRDIGVT